MRGIRFILAALTVALGSSVWMAEAPAAGGGGLPTRRAETAPATQDSAPKAALLAFFHAVLRGDEKTARDLLVFTDPAMEKNAGVMFAQVIVRQRLQGAVRDVFGEKAGDFSVGLTAQEIADVDNGFINAAVKIDGDKAQVITEKGPIYLLVRKDNKWKLDFDHTQSGLGALPPQPVMDAMKKQIDSIEQLTADVNAKKFQSPEEVQSKLDRIEDALRESVMHQDKSGAASAPGE